MKPFRGIMRSDPPSPRAAWQEIVDIIQRDGLAKAANLLERSEIIYLAGQLRSFRRVEAIHFDDFGEAMRSTTYRWLA